MIFKRYESEGLAHYSYLIADEGQAAAIDPRRDIDVYLQDAAQDQALIGRVFETHRNEDFLIGSFEIEEATGVEVFHADKQWDYRYGTPAEDGQAWMIGRLKIRAIHTPGHTPGSTSFWFEESKTLIAGDTLFRGGIGRTDFPGGDHEQIVSSIRERIYTLDEEATVITGHGPATTIASEKQSNMFVRA